MGAQPPLGHFDTLLSNPTYDFLSADFELVPVDDFLWGDAAPFSSKASESDEYEGYKVLMPSKSLKCNTNNFMKNGLDLFLRSKSLPSLEDDLSVQKIVDSLFNDASWEI